MVNEKKFGLLLVPLICGFVVLIIFLLIGVVLRS